MTSPSIAHGRCVGRALSLTPSPPPSEAAPAETVLDGSTRLIRSGRSGSPASNRQAARPAQNNSHDLLAILYIWLNFRGCRVGRLAAAIQRIVCRARVGIRLGIGLRTRVGRDRVAIEVAGVARSAGIS